MTSCCIIGRLGTKLLDHHLEINIWDTPNLLIRLLELMVNKQEFQKLNIVNDEWNEILIEIYLFLLIGFIDAGDQMREMYDDDYFLQNIAEIMSAVMPMYKHLFTYVRSRLIEVYGDKIRQDGPLPAHILGNMWAQNWNAIYDLVKPYPSARSLDITVDMLIQNYTPLRSTTNLKENTFFVMFIILIKKSKRHNIGYIFFDTKKCKMSSFKNISFFFQVSLFSYSTDLKLYDKNKTFSYLILQINFTECFKWGKNFLHHWGWNRCRPSFGDCPCLKSRQIKMSSALRVRGIFVTE